MAPGSSFVLVLDRGTPRVLLNPRTGRCVADEQFDVIPKIIEWIKMSDGRLLAVENQVTGAGLWLVTDQLAFIPRGSFEIDGERPLIRRDQRFRVWQIEQDTLFATRLYQDTVEIVSSGLSSRATAPLPLVRRTTGDSTEFIPLCLSTESNIE